jgi:hypothetical protein
VSDYELQIGRVAQVSRCSNLGYSYQYDAEGRAVTANGVQIAYDAFGRAAG